MCLLVDECFWRTMEITNTLHNCCICSESADDNSKLIHVSGKGVQTLLKICNATKANDVRRNIMSNLNGVFVYSECRKIFTDQKRQKQIKRKSDNLVRSKRVRSDFSAFDWKSCCFYCWEKINVKKVSFEHGSKMKKSFYRVETIGMRDAILEKCDERSDQWANDVKANILSCIDLVAVDAIYHFDCATKFRSGRPKEPVTGSGRKEDERKALYFDHTCEWLESNMELIRLSEAYDYMLKYAGNNEAYTARKFKQKLKEKYKERTI